MTYTPLNTGIKHSYYICQACGVLVVSKVIHTAWHAVNSREGEDL